MNVFVKVMGDVFPELKQNEKHIREIIAEEEASFGKTLLKVSTKFVFPMRHVPFLFFNSEISDHGPSWLHCLRFGFFSISIIDSISVYPIL